MPCQTCSYDRDNAKVWYRACCSVGKKKRYLGPTMTRVSAKPLLSRDVFLLGTSQPGEAGIANFTFSINSILLYFIVLIYEPKDWSDGDAASIGNICAQKT